MDEVDIAAKRVEEFNSDSIKSYTDLVPSALPRLTEDDVIECEECGVTIPHERARLGYVYCVPCSEYQDKINKRYNRRSIRNYDNDE